MIRLNVIYWSYVITSYGVFGVLNVILLDVRGHLYFLGMFQDVPQKVDNAV